jgi:hypothetical protein
MDDAVCGLPELEAGCGETQVDDTARHGDLLVAVGIAPSNSSDSFGGQAWTSVDGRAWQRIDGSLRWGGHVLSLASNGELLVAPATIFGDQPPHGRIWRSVDGAEWAEAQPVDAAYLDAYGDRDGFVALGGRPREVPAPSGALLQRYPFAPVILHSNDGVFWVDSSPPDETGIATAIARTAEGQYLVAGVSDAGAILVWRSMDGLAWDAAQVAPERTAPLGYVEGGARLAVSGAVVLLTSPTKAGPAAWISTDGATWLAVSAPSAVGSISALDPLTAAVTAVHIRGDQVIAFGVVRGDFVSDDQYVLWVGTLLRT